MVTTPLPVPATTVPATLSAAQSGVARHGEDSPTGSGQEPGPEIKQLNDTIIVLVSLDPFINTLERRDTKQYRPRSHCQDGELAVNVYNTVWAG